MAKATKELKRVARYNRQPVLKEDLIKPEETQTSRVRDLFSTPTIRKYTLLSCFIWYVYIQSTHFMTKILRNNLFDTRTGEI